MKKNELVDMLEEINRDIQEYTIPYEQEVLNVFKFYMNQYGIATYDLDENSIFLDKEPDEEEIDV